MTAPKQPMRATRPTYTQEFRDEAVRLLKVPKKLRKKARAPAALSPATGKSAEEKLARLERENE